MSTRGLKEVTVAQPWLISPGGLREDVLRIDEVPEARGAAVLPVHNVVRGAQQMYVDNEWREIRAVFGRRGSHPRVSERPGHLAAV